MKPKTIAQMFEEHRKKHVSKEYNYPKGICSIYFPLRNGLGLKIFQNPNTRDVVYRKQKLFAGLKLGPKVGRKIDFYNVEWYYGNSNLYCYVTQSAPPNPSKLADINEDYDFNGDFIRAYKVHAWDCSRTPTYETLTLFHNMNKCGYSIDDCHANNIGFIRNRPVFIDFDSYIRDVNGKPIDELNRFEEEYK